MLTNYPVRDKLMDKFLEIIGMLGAAVVLLITLMIVANSRGGADLVGGYSW